MVLRKHTKMLLFAIICLAGAISVYSFFASPKNLRTLSVRYDELLSQNAQTFMSDIIAQALANGKKAREIRAELQKIAPVINFLTISRRKPGMVNVLVKVERPLLLVKKIPSTHLILSQQGNYAPSKYYTQNARTGLPSIIIEQENFTDKDKIELYKWIQQLMTDFDLFFERYSATWFKTTHIVLKDKNDPSFYVIATTQTRFTPELQQKIDKTHQQTILKRKTKQWNKKLWKADVRFKDQIVLSPIKNGKGPR